MTDETPESAETSEWLKELAAGRFRGVVGYSRPWRGWRGDPGVLERDGNVLKLWDVTGAVVFSTPVAGVKLRHGYSYMSFKLRVEGQWWRVWGDLGNRRQQARVQELAERLQASVDAPRFPNTTEKEDRRAGKNLLNRRRTWYVVWRTVLTGYNAAD